MEHTKIKQQYFKELKENKRTKVKTRTKGTINRDKRVRTKVWTIGGYSNPIVHCPNLSKLLKKIESPLAKKRHCWNRNGLNNGLFFPCKNLFCGNSKLFCSGFESLFFGVYLACRKAFSKIIGDDVV